MQVESIELTQLTNEAAMDDVHKGMLNDEDEVSIENDFQEKAEYYTPAFCHYRILYPMIWLLSGEKHAFTQRQWTILASVSIWGFFNSFDWELFPMLLAQIQHSLDVSEERIGIVGSIIRLGNMLSFVLLVFADIQGRRKLLTISVVLYTIFTVSSAFVYKIVLFTIFQFLSRTFLNAQATLCHTMIVEEFDKDNRGKGMGLYSVVSVIGSGLAMLLFGFVGGDENGWRYLYALGIFQVPCCYFLFKYLPESKRFQHTELETSTKCDCFKLYVSPLDNLMRLYPTRLCAAASVSALNGFAFSSADMFKIKFMKEEHGMSPAFISVVALGTGIISLKTFSLAGAYSDRYGRKRMLVVLNFLVPLGVLGFYNAPNLWFLPFYLIQMQAGMGLMVVSSAYYAECFPTSFRATAQGFMSVLYILAGTLSMFLESLAFQKLQSHWLAVSVLVLPGFATPAIIYRYLPETSGLDLTAISPEEQDDEAQDMQLVPQTEY